MNGVHWSPHPCRVGINHQICATRLTCGRAWDVPYPYIQQAHSPPAPASIVPLHLVGAPYSRFRLYFINPPPSPAACSPPNITDPEHHHVRPRSRPRHRSSPPRCSSATANHRQLEHSDLSDYDSVGYNTTTESLTSSVNEYIFENGTFLVQGLGKGRR